MRVFQTIESISPDTFAGGTALAIGKFDGVHQGHRALLHRVAELALLHRLDPLVFTFTNHPLSLLSPEMCPVAIMSQQQRLEAFATENISACVMVPFDSQLAEMPAKEFAENLLVARLHVRYICVGADFRFGRGGLGTPEVLREMGRGLGFQVEIIENVEDPGVGRISSSRVREAILQGDVVTASRMMDRWVCVRGTVAHGDARGRELGFPTANLGGEIEGLRPADGVYAGWAVLGEKQYAAAISVGANVTFDPEGERRVEAHLIDFQGDLYGQQIEVRFVKRLRAMVAFSSVEALLVRMREDVSECRLILAAGPQVQCLPVR